MPRPDRTRPDRTRPDRTRRSAGLLLVRLTAESPEVLIAHPGGPFWARRDAGAWTIPKGEYGAAEDPLDAARREFTEELGAEAPPGQDCVALGEVRQSGGKVVTAWAALGDLDTTTVQSNTVEIEWPPRSGRRLVVPEIDRAEWVDIPTARVKLIAAQTALLDRLPWVQPI